LAAVIVVQPVSGIPCACIVRGADTAQRSAKQCCCGTTHHCCCGTTRHEQVSTTTQGACCQHKTNRDSAPHSVRACNCGSSAPAAPQSVPAARSQANDLAIPVLCAYVATVDVPTVHQDSWAVNLPAAFASASEHCVALCKLLF
jgi:hypothetical protein